MKNGKMWFITTGPSPQALFTSKHQRWSDLHLSAVQMLKVFERRNVLAQMQVTLSAIVHVVFIIRLRC